MRVPKVSQYNQSSEKCLLLPAGFFLYYILLGGVVLQATSFYTQYEKICYLFFFQNIYYKSFCKRGGIAPKQC